MPKGYNDWMKDNAERIANAKSLPYFVRDNIKQAEKAIGSNPIKQEQNAQAVEVEKFVDRIKKLKQSLTIEKFGGFAVNTEKEMDEVISNPDIIGKIKGMSLNGYLTSLKAKIKLHARNRNGIVR